MQLRTLYEWNAGAPLITAAFSQDSRFAIVTTNSAKSLAWNVTDGSAVDAARISMGAASDVVLPLYKLGNKEYLVTYDHEKASLQDLETNAEVMSFHPHGGQLFCVACSVQKRLLLTGTF